MERKPQKNTTKKARNKPKTLKTMMRICQKASVWLIKQGFLQKNDMCTKCGSKSVSEVVGKNGQRVMKCTNYKCMATMNVYKKNVLVRNLKLPDVLLIVYLWAEGIGFAAIQRMTGVGTDAISRLLCDIQQAIMAYCIANPPVMGGSKKVVEIDETEVGVRRKGVKGTPAKIKMDVWGCVDRNSGLLMLHIFNKLNSKGHHRFGPANASEVLPLVTKTVAAGSIVFSDGLAAYKSQLAKMGYTHDFVSHQAGQYAKNSKKKVLKGVRVHTNTIEGVWGNFKNWVRGKKGIYRARYPLYLYEFMWRHNIRITAPTSNVFHEILKLLCA